MKLETSEEKLSQHQLKSLLAQAKASVEIGAPYQHYKSPDMVYIVKDIVINEVDNQPYVVYQAQYGERITFARPVSVWVETVEYNGIEMPRFKKVIGRCSR